MNQRRIRLPILLAFVGVLALVGCIPLPATQQFMPNGNLKPSWKIGKGKSNPVWLGHTKLDEAIAFLSKHVSGKQWDAIFMAGPNHQDEPHIRSTWQKIDDHHFSMPYNVRAWIFVWPLCASATAETDGKYLILETDDANRIVDYDVISRSEFYDKYSAKAKDMFPRPKLDLLAPLTTKPTE